MKRVLAAMVVGLVLGGCAVGVEDPQPPPTPEPEQQQPPAQTFSAKLIGEPFQGSADGTLDEGIRNPPPKQRPPVPGLDSAPKAERAGWDR